MGILVALIAVGALLLLTSKEVDDTPEGKLRITGVVAGEGLVHISGEVVNTGKVLAAYEVKLRADLKTGSVEYARLVPELRPGAVYPFSIRSGKLLFASRDSLRVIISLHSAQGDRLDQHVFAT